MSVYISTIRWIIDVVKRKLCATQDDILQKPNCGMIINKKAIHKDGFNYIKSVII